MRAALAKVDPVQRRVGAVPEQVQGEGLAAVDAEAHPVDGREGVELEA